MFRAFSFCRIVIITIFIYSISTTPFYVVSQQSDYTVESLFIALFSDGDALVEYEIALNASQGNDSTVTVAGKTISELVVVDYDDNMIDHQLGDAPETILINNNQVPNLRITYQTPDLVDKEDRVWTFGINSTSELTLKLPAKSVVIDWGDNFPRFVRRVGEQDLLTFAPGNIQVKYIFGAIGTLEEANMAIKSAEISIRDIRERYPGIVLTTAEEMLSQAISARENKKYTDAVKFATQTDDQVLGISQQYASAQEAISRAENVISSQESANVDVSSSKERLTQSKEEFAAGNYVQAKQTAESSIGLIGSQTPSNNFIPFAIAISISAAVSGSALILWRYRRKRKMLGYQQDQEVTDKFEAGSSKSVDDHSITDYDNSHGQPINSGPLQGNIPKDEKLDTIVPEEKTENLSEQANLLIRIVDQLLIEKPYLRLEDQQVLRFLAENEGAAFESEVRNKFLMPKTTIWRLVKRLEREDLVEIRKAGGQNLIKLKYEERKAL